MFTPPSIMSTLPLAYYKPFGMPSKESEEVQRPTQAGNPPDVAHEFSLEDLIVRKVAAIFPSAVTWGAARLATSYIRFTAVPFEKGMEGLLRKNYKAQLETLCQSPDVSQKKINEMFQQAFNTRELVMSLGRELLLWGLVSPYGVKIVLSMEAEWVAPHIHGLEELHEFVHDAVKNFFSFGIVSLLFFGLNNSRTLFNLLDFRNPARLASVARRAMLGAIGDVRHQVAAGKTQCNSESLDKIEAAVKLAQNPGFIYSGFSAVDSDVAPIPPAPVLDPKIVGAVGGTAVGLLLLRQMAIRGVSSPNPIARASGLAAAAALYIFSGESIPMEEVFPRAIGYDDGGA